MYPINLEQQYSKYFTGRFETFARRLWSEVRPRLEHYINRMPVSLSATKRDSSDDDIYEFMEGLREEYQYWISAESMEAAIARNFSLIDAWARDKIVGSLETQLERLSTPQGPGVTGRPTLIGGAGERWLTTIDMLKRGSGMTHTMLERTVQSNLNLVRSLQGTQFDDVHQIITDGLTKGEGLNTIADAIHTATGINRHKAQFWARDQASKFFGDITEYRQTNAGIPGYVWRISGVRTRDAHRAVAGQYFDWKKPPAAGTGGKRVRPGQDYNCRCWAEPAFGPEYADPPNTKPSDPLGYMNQGSGFIQARTIDEAEAYARQFSDNASYRGIKRNKINVLNDINRSISDAITDFPELRNNMKFIGTMQAHYSYAAQQGYTTKRVSKRTYAVSIDNPRVSGISVNKSWINNDDFMDSLIDDVKTKFHPMGCDSIKSLIDHEIGHQLTGLLKLDEDTQIRYIWDGYAGNRKVITDDLSKYAWFNRNKNPIEEFISEAFAEYRNNAHCRPLAKIIGDIIMEKYRNYKGVP